MRVLISSSTFPIHRDDGLPRFVYDLAAALAAHCDVTALVPDAPGARPRELMDGIDVRRFRYFWPRRLQALAYGHGILDNLRASAWAKLQPPGFLASQAAATRSLVKREAIDLVNSHWLVPQGVSSALARAWGARFRHVVSVHAADVYLLARLPFGRALTRFVLSRTDRVLAVGTHVRDHLDALVGGSSGAVLQPMGARLELFREVDAAPVVTPFPEGYLLFCGRLAEKKGLVYLLRALPRVRERHPDLGLVVIGYGALEAELRREVVRLGLSEQVRFAGRQPHSEVARYLRGCRLAVVPSVVDRHGETEGMPTVVVEAMAAGTRVVGSAVDGIPDVIRHGENGWLARPKDPDDLAEKILDALSDSPGSDVLRQMALTAERFAWPRVAERYLETFEEVLRSGTPPT